MKEHLYHEEYRPEREQAAVEKMWEDLPKTEFIVEIANEHNPKYKDKVN